MVNKFNGGLTVSGTKYMLNTEKAHRAVLELDGHDKMPYDGQPQRYHPLVYAANRRAFRWDKKEYLNE